MIHILGYGIGLYILKNILTTNGPPGPQGLLGKDGKDGLPGPPDPRQLVNCKELCKTILDKEKQKAESVLKNIMVKRSTNKQ